MVYQASFLPETLLAQYHISLKITFPALVFYQKCTVDVFPDRLELRGYGVVKSATLYFGGAKPEVVEATSEEEKEDDTVDAASSRKA